MFARIILFFFLLSFSLTNAAEPSLVLTAAKKELKRTMERLADQPNPPYFLSYAIRDVHEATIRAEFGKITQQKEQKQRFLDIDIRVGDYQFDNTHIIRGNPFNFRSGRGYSILPVEPDEKALRNVIWYSTDEKYKEAIETFEKARTNQAVKVQEEDTSADMSHEQAYRHIEAKPEYNIDIGEWKKRAAKLSMIFADYDWIYEGNVIITGKSNMKYFVNSEGSELQWPETYMRIYVNIKTKSDDGMSLPLYKSYFSFDYKELPGNGEIKNDIGKMIDLLDRLRKAPKLEQTYSGPAILSGKASGVFFHEIFGHRVEGHREKDPNSSQTFKNSIGMKILPEFIDVVFDPTLRTLEGIELSGFYQYDDEGMKSQKVVVAKDGKFNSFLMSRSPIEKFPKSNGHGRKQEGYKAVSRQSNLIVEAEETVSVKELKEMLREECRKQDKEYGLYFDQVQGGFTFTGRVIPNAFNVNPLVVYKVYADGRPDELLRGVDLIGTPLATFANIEAAGDDMDTFNGICGAESGGVPVSASSPSLLVSLIEVQKKQKSQAKPPVLPAP